MEVEVSTNGGEPLDLMILRNGKYGPIQPPHLTL